MIWECTWKWCTRELTIYLTNHYLWRNNSIYQNLNMSLFLKTFINLILCNYFPLNSYESFFGDFETVEIRPFHFYLSDSGLHLRTHLRAMLLNHISLLICKKQVVWRVRFFTPTLEPPLSEAGTRIFNKGIQNL